MTAGQNTISVRIDKWLWAARFFKTRALAYKACDLGRIHSNEIEAKPARDVRVGDMLRIKNEGGEFHVEVLQLSEIRGPAAVAQTLYRETQASKEKRQREAAERKAMQQYAPAARTPALQARPPPHHPVPQRRLTASIIANLKGHDLSRIIQSRSGA